MTSVLPNSHPLSGFQLMAKPVGPACDQACDYCYYVRKTPHLKTGRRMRMAPDLLERYVAETISTSAGPDVYFLWQGGEPTLAGRRFFETAFTLQEKHRLPGIAVKNALQTHGGHLDDNWVRFLKDNDVLVGLSLDGPRAIHDSARHDRRGRPTFTRTRAAVDLLLHHQVDFNTLTVVHANNWQKGDTIYRYLRRIGVRHMQFIPIVERYDANGADAGPPPASAARLSPLTVPAEGYGAFLVNVFEAWAARDIGRVSVQSFEILLAQILGLPAGLCVFAEMCGQCPVLEHDGTIYACDHYVYRSHRIGVLGKRPLAKLVASPAQTAFGAAKADLPADCRVCQYRQLCHGGCPKHRFVADTDGGTRLNYLCPSYRKFFAYAVPRLTTIHRASMNSGPSDNA